MEMTTPMQSKPLVNATCKLGKKGCYEDGRCYYIGDCVSKIKTNADRIRAMSDEELAGYMAKMLADYTTGLYDGRYVPSDKVVCEMASELLRQLQQPYESEETI